MAIEYLTVCNYWDKNICILFELFIIIAIDMCADRCTKSLSDELQDRRPIASDYI